MTLVKVDPEDYGLVSFAKKMGYEVEWEYVPGQIDIDFDERDSYKFGRLRDDLDSLKTKYSFMLSGNKKKYEGVGKLIDKIIIYIR